VADKLQGLYAPTVHFPIGLLSISFALDALQLAPAFTSGLNYLKVLPPAAAVNVLSHYTGAAGLLAAVPTVASGLSELCVAAVPRALVSSSFRG